MKQVWKERLKFENFNLNTENMNAKREGEKRTKLKMGTDFR